MTMAYIFDTNIFIRSKNEMPIDLGSGDRYLNHRNTIEKWHAKQERIQIAESITPTAHMTNSSPNRSINIFMTETNKETVT